MTKTPNKTTKTKLPKLLRDAVDTPPPSDIREEGPNSPILDVTLHLVDTDDVIHGQCLMHNLIIRPDQDIIITWLDGGHTYTPMKNVSRIHYEIINRH